MWALFFGLLSSVVLGFISYSNNQRHIVVLSGLLGLFSAAQFFLLGKWAALAMNLATFVFTVLTFFFMEKSFWKPAKVGIASVVWLTLVYSLVIGFPDSFFEWLPYFGSVLMSVLILFKNRWVIKSVAFLAGVCWTVYQVKSGAWGQVAGQFIYFGAWFWSVRNMLIEEVDEDEKLVKTKKKSWLLGSKIDKEEFATV